MVKRLLLLLALVAAHPAAALEASAAASAAAGATGGSAAATDTTAGAGSPRSASRFEAEKYRLWKSKAAKILMARGDANSLATAAALTFSGSGLKPDTAKWATAPQDLAARAVELAPQNAAIGWLRLSLCGETPACDIRDAATVMRWVDADNGAAWLPTLAAAQKDRDRTEVERVLTDMAQGSHFDLYLNRLIVLMFDALTRAHGELPRGYAGSDSARFALVKEIADGEFIPPLSPLLEACRESLAVGERRELCLKLSKTMQRSDTIVAQMTGFSIGRRLLPPDGKEARVTVERRRALEWRVTAAAKFDSAMLPWTKNGRVRARLAQMRAMPREEDVCVAILRQHKVAVDPPEAHQ